jgi:hypothetical protein
MKLRPNQIVTLYFNSWWIPALLLMVLFATREMAARASYSDVPLWKLTVVLSIMLHLAFVGTLSACIWNLIKKRWAKGFINLLMFIIGGVKLNVFLSFLLLVAIFCSLAGTTTPTTATVDYCRTELHLNPSMKITPLGFMQPFGFDQDILFKFKTDSNDISRIFDASVVDVNRFRENFTFSASEQKEPKWWDVKGKSLLGGSVQFSESSENIGIEKQDDGCLVYIESCR